MYAYTGEYQGKKVSVMASGMGMPSMVEFILMNFIISMVLRI